MPVTIVCTFIARGDIKEKSPQGQDLLFFTTAKDRKAEGGPDPRSLTHVLVETIGGPLVPGVDPLPTDPLLASQQSLAVHLFLDTRKDLKLVRRGKRIHWEQDCYLESFLWRTVESYERGLYNENEIRKAQEQGTPIGEGMVIDPSTYEADMLHYRTIESKLGKDCHYWEGYAVFDDPTLMNEEFVSTSYYCVALPPVFDIALGDITSAPLSASETSQIALDVLFELVSKRFARHSFRYWAPGIPPPGPNDKEIPQAVWKYRIFTYFIDVAIYHLRKAKPVHETVVSSVLLRVIKPLQALVSDGKVSLADFEKEALMSISREVSRGKMAMNTLAKAAISKILERPQPKEKDALAAWKKKRPLLHIFSIGFTPAVFNVLRELVHYLLTIASHPYSTLTLGATTMSKEQEREWLNRPDLIKLTIAESRPNCEGVALARSVLTVVEESTARAKQLRDLSRSYADPSGVRHLPKTGVLASGSPGTHTQIPTDLMQRLKLNQKSGSSPLSGTYGTLSDLLRKADDATPPDGMSKVEIEVIPDAAIVSSLVEAGSSVVVLIGAERILPGDADVVAKLGSYAAAWTAKEQKASVLVLAPCDTIEPEFGDKKPKMTQGEAREVTDAWSMAGSCNYEGLGAFVTKVLDKEGVKVVNQESDIVPAKFISAWITESGILNAAGCCTLGKERGEAEKKTFGTD